MVRYNSNKEGRVSGRGFNVIVYCFFVNFVLFCVGIISKLFIIKPISYENINKSII